MAPTEASWYVCRGKELPASPAPQTQPGLSPWVEGPLEKEFVWESRVFRICLLSFEEVEEDRAGLNPTRNKKRPLEEQVASFGHLAAGPSGYCPKLIRIPVLMYYSSDLDIMVQMIILWFRLE